MEVLTTKQAAAFLGYKPTTLKQWRTLKKGPKYKLLSPRRAVYFKSDLEAYLAAAETVNPKN